MQETRRQILAAIGNGPITGPEVADQLDISRAAVWKQVEALRDAGFEISGDQGYQLDSIPEFGGAAVEFGLDAPFEIEFHESIDSTNARAREIATDRYSRPVDQSVNSERETPHDIVVLADEQTGGRGRLEREWSSPSGGIWMSILLQPAIPATQAPIYTLAAAVATTRAVRELGIEAAIKWPNDVLVGGQKLCGILTEMEGEADRISWLIVGIGLNCNVSVDELPPESTSIRALHGDVNRRNVTQMILEEFHQLSNDIDAIIPAWRELSATIGQNVRVETSGKTIQGRAKDIEFPGTLIVETDTGVESVAAGDCEHLRPN